MTTKELKEMEQLQDTLDLMVDEFERIKNLADAYSDKTYPLKYAIDREIIGLCERAISGLKQRVPLIGQRDKAEAKVRDLTLRCDTWKALAQELEGRIANALL